MRAGVALFLGAAFGFGGSFTAHAAPVTLFSQPDDSGEMVTQQATFAATWLESESLGNLFLGKGPLTLTFTLKDPNASSAVSQPQGVALETCVGCQNLQKYLFTDADRALLSDGQFHTFTVTTDSTTLGLADGETPVYIRFFNLSQYHQSTHLKSNSAGTIPTLTIEAEPPVREVVPELPAGATILYRQEEKSSEMTTIQANNLNAYIDSQSIGNVALGQGSLFLKFLMRDPHASNLYGTPIGVCLQPTGSIACSTALQTYRFTEADRDLLSDGASHTFMVETGTTTSTYADGTQPVSIGFFGLSQFQGGTKIKSNAAATLPAVTIGSVPEDPPEPGVSSVMFLPGIKASRLYGDTACGGADGEKFWDPFVAHIGNIILHTGDDKGRKLFLDGSGRSICSEIYTKAGDVIDEVGLSKIHASFIGEMNGLKTDGTIADWRAAAYDWRLSLDALLTRGAETSGKIYFDKATTTPYIEQTLRELAATSKTGKVTIVAHSNGGLVAKALLKQLGSEASKLVDKIIMVGVPQTGAPVAVGAVLYGYDQNLSPFGVSILSSTVARQLALNSPMAYHLLPSKEYLESAGGDTAHPIARFSGDAYATERAAYGNTLTTQGALTDFLLAKEGGRVAPPLSHIGEAAVGNPALVAYGAAQHAALDNWAPPEGIEVHQIAGWGDSSTVAGIDFYTLPPISPFASRPVRAYRPIFTEDGDGVVPVPSALHMPVSSTVKRYWLDLDLYFKDTKVRRSHANIFEVPSLKDLIKSILIKIETLPSYVSLSQPPVLAQDKKLMFFLHSPLTLQVSDSSGNTTGLSADGSVAENIPNSTFGEFGEVKYVIVPAGGQYKLALDGQGSGTFSLDIQESSGGTITNSATIAHVPTTPNTKASLTLTNLTDISPLTVDTVGNGQTITLIPKIGETVIYEAPSIAPTSSSGGRAPTPATDTPATSTQSAISVVTAALPEQVNAFFPQLSSAIEGIPTPADPELLNGAETENTSVPSSTPESGQQVLQTASVYGAASAQTFFSWLGNLLYTIFHAIWSFLVSLFT